MVNFYNQWDLIKRQITNLESIIDDKSKVKLILIDDCSRENKLSEISTDLNIEKYRILERKKDWNAGGARNLGFHVADDGLILSYDSDHFPDKKLISYLIDVLNPPNGIFFRFKRNIPERPIPYNIYAIQKSDFWKCGGYDEDFEWYGDDKSFIHRVTHMLPTVTVDVGKFNVVQQKSEGNRDLLPKTRELLNNKINNITPWSTEYLRFKWEPVK